MLTRTVKLDLSVEKNLEHVIEPLASYICAADRPREALLSALALLFNEVDETNQAVLMHMSYSRVDSLGLAP